MQQKCITQAIEHKTETRIKINTHKMTKIISLPLFVLATMLSSGSAQTCSGLDAQQCRGTDGCTWIGRCVLSSFWDQEIDWDPTPNLDVVSLEADKYDDGDGYNGGGIKRMPPGGAGDNDYGNDISIGSMTESDDEDAASLPDDEDEGDTWSVESDSSNKPTHSNYGSNENTRLSLRGAASQNTYFSAVSVGNACNPQCRGLGRNRCNARPDCRWSWIYFSCRMRC